jgi:hypothetical protein
MIALGATYNNTNIGHAIDYYSGQYKVLKEFLTRGCKQ